MKPAMGLGRNVRSERESLRTSQIGPKDALQERVIPGVPPGSTFRQITTVAFSRPFRCHNGPERHPINRHDD